MEPKGLTQIPKYRSSAQNAFDSKPKYGIMHMSVIVSRQKRVQERGS